MKPFVNKKTIKNLIISFAIVIFLLGAIPVPVQAKTDTQGGGGLLAPIEMFVVFIGDSLMQWMQDVFVSTEKIKQDDGTFKFQYTPAVIFSGTVPALDINFINPKKNDDYEKFFESNIENYKEDVKGNNVTYEYYKEKADIKNRNDINIYNGPNNEWQSVGRVNSI